ncbi:MAG: tRNA (adenosine(37)-N6)-dimethylallyltransferase MiaA [Minisyncoccia bacterium]|jgi:tRNA dimethylallyltransferase
MTKYLKIKNPNKKLLVIVGPTASGKSDLAIEIAKKFDGEIVSADSRQIYKGMNLGTGKVAKDTEYLMQNTEYYSSGIRHYLLDIAEPQEYFSVAQYQKLALEAIKDIQKRNKLPILCGGTGLYINALIEGWELPEVSPNQKLRQELEKLDTEELFLKLQKLDPKRAKTIDKNNKIRLIRALEIIDKNKEVKPLKKNPLPYDILILSIKKENKELKELIKKRLIKRLEEGMIEEIKKLKEEGIPSKRFEDFGLEYRWINRYLENKISYEEMVNKLYRDICHYAKRQMTWIRNKIFKSQFKSHWVNSKEEAINLVSLWLQDKFSKSSGI